MSLKSGGNFVLFNLIQHTKGWIQTRTSCNCLIAGNIFYEAPGIALLGENNAAIGNELNGGRIIVASGNATIKEISTERNGVRPWQGQHPASLNSKVFYNVLKSDARIEVGKRKTGGRPKHVKMSHHKRNIPARNTKIGDNQGGRIVEHSGKFKGLDTDANYSGKRVEPFRAPANIVGHNHTDTLQRGPTKPPVPSTPTAIIVENTRLDDGWLVFRLELDGKTHSVRAKVP